MESEERWIAAQWDSETLCRELGPVCPAEAHAQFVRDAHRSGRVQIIPGLYPAHALACASQIGWALPYRHLQAFLGSGPLLSTQEGRRMSLERHGVVHQAVFRTLEGRRWAAWYCVRWDARGLTGSRLLARALPELSPLPRAGSKAGAYGAILFTPVG